MLLVPVISLRYTVWQGALETYIEYASPTLIASTTPDAAREHCSARSNSVQVRRAASSEGHPCAVRGCGGMRRRVQASAPANPEPGTGV
jgi:hypothetical protein